MNAADLICRLTCFRALAVRWIGLGLKLIPFHMVSNIVCFSSRTIIHLKCLYMEQLGHTDAIHLIGFTYARVTRLLDVWRACNVIMNMSKSWGRFLRIIHGPWIFLKQVPPGRGLPQDRICARQMWQVLLWQPKPECSGLQVCDVSCQCTYIPEN